MSSEIPTYVVIFISQRTEGDNGYGAMAERMVKSVEKFNGYLGSETVRDAQGLGITVSYWQSLDDIARWKADAEHQQAQHLGHEQWYERIRLTVAKVEKDVRWYRGQRIDEALEILKRAGKGNPPVPAMSLK